MWRLGAVANLLILSATVGSSPAAAQANPDKVLRYAFEIAEKTEI